MDTTRPTPPPLTGDIHQDGMSAIAFVLSYCHLGAVECELTRAQLEAAEHIAPLVTRRRQDEDPRVLATTTRAIARITSQLRIARRNDQDASQDAPAAPRSADRPNLGPMAPLQPVPRPTPPQTPARPMREPDTIQF